MQPRVVTVGPLVAGSANNIALSQTEGAAGALTLNGSTVSNGVATLDTARRVIITSAGNDSGITFTISGTGFAGQTQSEVVTGANAGAASSVLDYATVTSIVASGATASTVTAGTNGIAASPWIMVDPWAFGTVSGQCVAAGTVNYSVQTSDDDPNSYANPVAPSAMTWDTTVAATTSQTANASFSVAATPLWYRVLLNSGTGSVRMTIVQHASVVR